MSCCRCNRSGRCRNCSCVKNGIFCQGCLPQRLGNCSNTTMLTSNQEQQPPRSEQTSVQCPEGMSTLETQVPLEYGAPFVSKLRIWQPRFSFTATILFRVTILTRCLHVSSYRIYAFTATISFYSDDFFLQRRFYFIVTNFETTHLAMARRLCQKQRIWQPRFSFTATILF